MKRVAPSRMICYAVLSFCTALAMTMRFAPSDAKQGSGFLSEAFRQLYSSAANSGVSQAVIFAAVFALAVYVYLRRTDALKNGSCKKAVSDKVMTVINVLIVLVWLCGESLRTNDTLGLIYIPRAQLLKSSVYVLGYSFFLNKLCQLIILALTSPRRSGTSEEAKGYERFRSFYGKWCSGHHRLKTFALLFAVYLPQLIICYPANFCIDAYNQLAQFYGINEFTSHHPPVMTLLMGAVTKLGSVVSINFGLFLFVLLQCAVLCAVLSHMFALMRELKAPVWLSIAAFLCCVFIPYYGAYVPTFLKDNLFTYFFLLFIVELIYMLKRGEDYFKSPAHIALWSLSIICSVLFRNNGKYELYPLILVMLIAGTVSFVKRKSFGKKAAVYFCVIALPCIISEGINIGVMKGFDIKKGSVREMLSLPMQQTARYVKEYGSSVTEEERAAIDAVMDYDNLAKLYNPRISDPVKNTFKVTSFNKELTGYLKVWFKMLFKHPEVYVKATLNQNYYLLYPFMHDPVIYFYSADNGLKYKPYDALQEKLGFTAPESLKGAKSALEQFNKSLFNLPVISLLSTFAFYNILTVWIIVLMFREKLYKLIYPLIPLLLSVAMVLLGPVAHGHPRYSFPNIFSFPILLAFVLFLLAEGRKKGSASEASEQ